MVSQDSLQSKGTPERKLKIMRYKNEKKMLPDQLSAITLKHNGFHHAVNLSSIETLEALRWASLGIFIQFFPLRILRDKDLKREIMSLAVFMLNIQKLQKSDDYLSRVNKANGAPFFFLSKEFESGRLAIAGGQTVVSRFRRRRRQHQQSPTPPPPPFLKKKERR